MHLVITFLFTGVALGSLLELTQQQVQIERDEYQHLRYGNFKAFLNHELNVSAILANVSVQEYTECAFACLKKVACYSFNIAIERDITSKQYSCHLLSTDKYRNADRFVLSQRFHYYAIPSPCDSIPCKSSGACRPLYSENDYMCICNHGWSGKTCDRESCQTVGIEDRKMIPDSSMTASSTFSSSHSPYFGRFKEARPGSARWCPKTSSDRNDYLQVDLGKVNLVCAIATQGTTTSEYTTSYKLRFSINVVTWETYKVSNYEKVFPGSTGSNAVVVKHSLNSTIKARYVRFYPVTFHSWPCLRVEIYVQE
ncbi:EGF-like repeat and discoidin I-like domain-containing protein 3 [Montipora capricornis]|uniref:EGF-like repeat and discoidin I-like domain-containing protein 3 n=1 Tax=Montipora capricornis TaxID=246305 RepID=UPI0035F20BC7